MSIVRDVCSIPEGYRDLIEGRVYAALSTVQPGGQPQSTGVWWDIDGDHVLINTMRGFSQEKNMRATPGRSPIATNSRSA